MHTIMMGILWLAAFGIAIWAAGIILQIISGVVVVVGVAIWAVIRAVGRFFGG